jgi:hypothetical protein
MVRARQAAEVDPILVPVWSKCRAAPLAAAKSPAWVRGFAGACAIISAPLRTPRRHTKGVRTNFVRAPA